MRSFTDYLNEKMDPRKHAVERDGKFVVVDKDGETVKTFDDKEAAEKYAVANHDKLMEGCGCDGTNEDVSSKDAGRIGAAISNRKDLPASEKNVARRSLQRKVARAKRREKAFNVNADSGSRYRVGTKRPTSDTDPKHKGLRRNNVIAKTLKSYGTNEDVEQVDELSAKALKKYRVKSIKDREDAVRQGYNPNTGQLDPEAEKRRKKRLAGFSRAKRKLVAAEDVEQVDESSGKFQQVLNKGKKLGDWNMMSYFLYDGNVWMLQSGRAVNQGKLEVFKKKAQKGLLNSLTFKEDVEQVDELKSSTLRSYLGKARKDNQTRVIRMADKPSHMPTDKGEMDKLRKRRKGSEAAASRLDARKHNLEPSLKREDVELDELKMPKGGLEKGTFKNPALMLKLLTTGGKGKRKRKVEEEKKDKIKVKLDPKKKIGYEVRSVGPGGKTTVTKRRDMPDKEDVGEASGAWQRKEGKNKEGGLNAAGRASYERENPGSDLKAPVSAEQAKKSKGGRAAKRRKSFCARMGGMKGAMKDEKGRPTRKALALRKWDC